MKNKIYHFGKFCLKVLPFSGKGEGSPPGNQTSCTNGSAFKRLCYYFFVNDNGQKVNAINRGFPSQLEELHEVQVTKWQFKLDSCEPANLPTSGFVICLSRNPKTKPEKLQLHLIKTPCKRTESFWPRTRNIVWVLHVGPFALSCVCCCVLLGAVAQSSKPVKLFESTTPNNIFFVPCSPKRSPVLLNPLLGPRLVSLNIIQDASCQTANGLFFPSDLVRGEHAPSARLPREWSFSCLARFAQQTEKKGDCSQFRWLQNYVSLQSYGSYPSHDAL